jgi:hypothetical protein
MSEAEKPKRKVWQFHLSTGIAMTLAAGLLLYFEQLPHVRMGDYYPTNSNHYPQWNVDVDFWCGFPWRIWDHPNLSFYLDTKSDEEFSKHASDFIAQNRYEDISLAGLAADIIFAAVIIFVVGLTSEWLIRRREARNDRA